MYALQQEKSMIVSDNTIQAEGLSDFFKNLCKKGLNVSKKMVKYVFKNHSKALDITANIPTGAVFKNFKNVMSALLELITFYKTGRGLYLSKIVYIMLYKWSKKLIEYTQLHH